mgnify:CR=1 FL=1
MKTLTELIEEEKRLLEKSFIRSHSQMAHIGKDSEKRSDCETCKEDKVKNPKGYYLTFLTEQRCYWNRELFNDIQSFLESSLTRIAHETLRAVEAIRLKPYEDGEFKQKSDNFLKE